MQPTRRALVAGGTGLVGSELLALLSADPRYSHVTSLVRRPVTTTGKIESRVVDFDDLDRVQLPDVEDAFCCLGTTRAAAGSDEAYRQVDFDYILAFARAAQRSKARRFLLVTSMGANAQSKFLYTRVKGESEAAVIALAFPVTGIVRPSVLVGQRAKARPSEAAAVAITRVLNPLMVGPLRPYRPIAARTVATALVNLAFTAPNGVTVLSSEQTAALGSAQ